MITTNDANKEKGAKLVFRDEDGWIDRNRSLEAYAINATSESITEAALEKLSLISENDEVVHNRGLAYSMLESYRKNKDFSLTKPYIDFQMEQVRLTIKPKVEFGYKASDSCYNREKSLEHLVRTTPEITDELIADLQEIAQKEDDHRVSGLAMEMVDSYRANKDFTQTKKHEEIKAALKAEQVRLSIKLKSNIGYDPKADWIARRDAINHKYGPSKSSDKIDDDFLDDLQTISEKDDNWMVQEAADKMRKAYLRSMIKPIEY